MNNIPRVTRLAGDLIMSSARDDVCRLMAFLVHHRGHVRHSERLFFKLLRYLPGFSAGSLERNFRHTGISGRHTRRVVHHSRSCWVYLHRDSLPGNRAGVPPGNPGKWRISLTTRSQVTYIISGQLRWRIAAQQTSTAPASRDERLIRWNEWNIHREFETYSYYLHTAI